MSSFLDAEEIHKLDGFLEILNSIGLDFSWVLSITALSAQEIAIKKKLDDLGVSYDEDDFQKLADKLIDRMKECNLEVSEILLSISRSYRHIRAKILHAPHKTRLNPEEASAIYYNTEALLRSLFKREIGPDTSEFIESIYELRMDKTLTAFKSFDTKAKKRIFEAIFDRIILLEWDEILPNKVLFDFIQNALRTEYDTSVLHELFSVLLQITLVGGPSFGRERLLSTIAELTKLSSIRDFLKDSKWIDQLVTEFESSGSFDVAAANSQIILNLSSLLDKKQINRVVDASLSNDQILYSFGAKTNLKKFLVACRQDLSQENADKLASAL